MCNFTELGEINNMMMKYDTNILQEYASPSVKVIEVNAQRVLCVSGDIDGFTKDADDSENWS